MPEALIEEPKFRISSYVPLSNLAANYVIFLIRRI